MNFEAWESPEGRPEKPLPDDIGAVVAALAARKGWQTRLHGARVHSAWNEIAGEELARHIQPVRLAGGVLVVRAQSPAWATQVQYLATELRDRANAVLGAGQVRTVTVQADRPATGRKNPR